MTRRPTSSTRARSPWSTGTESGKHHRVVEGINLLTLLWSDGDRHVSCDFRLYDAPHDGLTKNDHFRALLAVAAKRGFASEGVAFDGWYASLENLKGTAD